MRERASGLTSLMTNAQRPSRVGHAEEHDLGFDHGPILERLARGVPPDAEAGGFIINISSIAGKEAWSGTGAYSASKFGVMALTQALADEGKPHTIKCAAICPALVATPMTGASGAEFLQPEDIAETVLYLLRLSPACWPTEVVLPRRGAE